MQVARVSSKGQLVVPAGIRRKYGIKPGTRIVFVEENGRVILQPVTAEYIRSFRGLFKLKKGEKAATQELREDRDAERKREEARRANVARRERLLR